MTPRLSPAVPALPALLLAGCAVFGSSVAGDAVAVEVIEGDPALSESEMRASATRELRSFVETGRKADLADAAYAVERGLRRAGHAHARVGFIETTGDTPASLRVSAGPVAEIEKVTFGGDPAFPDERLLPFFVATDSGLLSSGGTRYSRSLVDEAIANIERLHLLEGYREVRVGPPDIEWSDDRAFASVHVPVQRGARTVLGRVRIVGIEHGDLRADVRDAMPQPGGPYHVRLPAEVAARARRVLLDRGHQAQQVAHEVTIDAEQGAEIVLSITPGPVFRVRDVDVRGVERSRRSFVRSRLAITPGNVARQSLLDQSTGALYGTGVFDRVTTRFEPAGAAEGEPQLDTTLIVEVTETPARSFEAEAGWGSYEQARGRVRYTDRNLAGTGRILDATMSASLKSAGISTRLEDRYLLGVRNVLSAEAGYRVREEPTFEEREANLQAAVRREFGRGLSIRGGYLLRFSEAHNVDGTVLGAESSGFERSAGPFAILARDTRDDRLFPTKGGVGEAGLFWSVPALGAELEYVETRLAYATYVALGPETVLAVGTRLATREVLDEEKTLPVQERLFLGGEQSVRSFGESELGPIDVSGDPLGGLTAVHANVELRQRLVGDLDGAVFYDIGNVSRRSWHLSDRSGHALGVGLRYRLPVGPLRVDFGWNPGGERFAADRDWALHVSFGFSF